MTDATADACGILQFMSSSRRMAPGLGAGEVAMTHAVSETRIGQLVGGLPEDFRSLLSNFAPFPEDNLLTLRREDVQRMLPDGVLVPADFVRQCRFLSVEHAFHFLKFMATGHHLAALCFVWDSTHPVARSRDGYLVKKAGGRAGLALLSKDDQVLWAAHRQGILRALTLRKFSDAHPQFQDVLIATGPMRLVHAVRGHAEEWDWLYGARAAAQHRCLLL
jgi:hypothetical protein